MKYQITRDALQACCCLGVGMLPFVTGCDTQRQSKSSTAPSATQTEKTVAAPTAAEEIPANLERFKAETKPLLAWVEARKTPPKNGPGSPAADMAEFLIKVKAVNSDGLPADLKAAWLTFVKVMEEVEGQFRTLPKVEPGLPQTMPPAMAGIAPKLQELAAKARPIVKELAEIGRKHGIPDLEKLGPGEPPPANGPIPSGR